MSRLVEIRVYSEGYYTTRAERSEPRSVRVTATAESRLCAKARESVALAGPTLKRRVVIRRKRNEIFFGILDLFRILKNVFCFEAKQLTKSCSFQTLATIKSRIRYF